MKRIDCSEKMTQKRIKALHLKQIILLSLKGCGVSKAQIKRNLHISFPSASALADELLEKGILVEKGIAEGCGRGRPSTILQINPHNYVVPVVVMIPNGFETYIFDISANLLEEDYLPFDYGNNGSTEHITDIPADILARPIIQWIEEIKIRYKPLSLMISASGSVRYGVFSSSVYQFKVSDDIFSCIQDKTGLDVILGNKATYYAYGEKQLRSSNSDFIFIYIGNGVGAGVICNGRILGDDSARSGEIGHISIDYRGRECACGNKGCLEQYISIDAIVRDAGMPFEEVCSAYKKQERDIVNLLNQKAEQLAVGISSMLSMQSTDHIIIGGEIRMLGPLFLDALREKAKKVGMRKLMNHISFEYSNLGDNGDAYGALWDFLDHYFEVESIME